jgi:chaperonin GroEL
MRKRVLFNQEVRAKILAGATIVADAVRITQGPRGRNVAISRSYGGPRITNDGVSISKEISLKDPFENIGAEVVKEVASKTNDMAGDGTTTAVVLAHAILSEGFKRIAMGANAVMVRRGIEAAAKDAVAELKAMAKQVKNADDIRNVASVSAESAELGKTIADTIDKVGVNGVVTVEESQSFGIESEITEGMEFDKGYISPYLITNTERMEAEYKDAQILLTDKKISSVQDVLPLLEAMMKSGKKELVIIADDVDGEALSTFIVNKLRGGLSVLAIKAPGYGDRKKEILQDIAVLTGATVVSEEVGMKLNEVGMDVLGRASRVVATKDKTLVVGGKGKKSEIESRVAQLKSLLTNTDSKFDKEKLAERIAKLTGGVAIIRVGASTETEMKYLKDKIEDAVNATKAAIEEGIVPGGGSALAKVSAKLEKNKHASEHSEFGVGYRILAKALAAPLMQIALNAGRDDAAVILRDVVAKGGSYGFDASKDGVDAAIVDMLKEGIIDPVKVSRAAVQNAASAAAVLLTTEAAIADEPEQKAAPAGGGGMGGGMDY